MNNKQNDTNRGLLDTQRSKSGGMYEDFVNKARTQYDSDRGDDANLRNEIFNKYTSSNNFMPSGMTPNSQGWFDIPDDGSGSGHAAGGDYSQAKSGFGSMASTGGQETFQPALDSYKGFMENGGIGGAQAEALRARATAMVPAFYDKYKSALQRRANVQGGYSPGYDSQMQEIGREAGREGFNASRQVEGDIVDKRLAGMQFGTAGYANAAGQITGNKLSGLGGLKGIGDSEQSNNQFNAGMDESRAGRKQQMQQFLQDQYSSGSKASAAGLQGLYSSAPGASNASANNYLSGLGGMSSNELQNLAMRLGIKDKSIDWAKVAQMVGTGASVAAMASDRNIKENIVPVEDSIIKKFQQIPVSRWNYIGDDITHIGPMAQDMKEVFGVGDGKTINPVDVFGLLVLLGKELALQAN